MIFILELVRTVALVLLGGFLVFIVLVGVDAVLESREAASGRHRAHEDELTQRLPRPREVRRGMA